MNKFELVTTFKPTGDQPQAIKSIVETFKAGKSAQVLLGVTGSGKTFTMANVIAELNRPTLILAHNKTLAAQLFSEFKAFFPKNAVEYFVSYYDYYQPEAYIASTDTFIEKDSQINEDIDKLRHRATTSLLKRKDVIIVSSVSCIYGLGSPEDYLDMRLEITLSTKLKRKELLLKLVEMQYTRNDIDFHRGTFRVRGDTVDVFPSSEDSVGYRIEFFGDDIDGLFYIDSLTGKKIDRVDNLVIFPGSHYVTESAKRKRAIETIREELRERLIQLKSLNKHLEYQRLEQRTLYDLEMLEEIGFCKGIENYSRHMTGRPAGMAPPTLIEYFPKDFLLFVDESHVTIPQVTAMYKGDRSRKENLVEHGFRMPSALDNRPLKFDEFEKLINTALYVSATPAKYEIEKAQGEIVEQVIRPTGLLDPEIEVRPAEGQVFDLEKEIIKIVAKKQRVLVTTLTKKMAEELTNYLAQKGHKVKYLHSDIETLERIEIIRGLRLGEFDVLVGINLLREGLDIPEVSLVAILDADKEGFLRSERSLVQTIGRAARNSEGKVILYADKITDSMKAAMEETYRRRKKQEAYNEKHGITPTTIKKLVSENDTFAEMISTKTNAKSEARNRLARKEVATSEDTAEFENKLEERLLAFGIDIHDPGSVGIKILDLEKQMKEAAAKLEFEKAANIRDKLKELKEIQLFLC